MDILLIRHGEAVEDPPGLGDAGRWLTKKGRKVTRKVARWLGKSRKRTPATIWTSPLVRALQTAEILAAETGYRGEVRACSQLSPGHDPGDLLKLLAAEPIEGPIALVGHEPALSLIAHALLGDAGFTGLKKNGVLALSWDPPQPEDEPRGPSSVREPAAKGRLWFVLDPARMKSRKQLAPPEDASPPTIVST
jgi:phosphohistidine phosphatase